MTQPTANDPRQSNLKVVGWCLAGVVGMFAFGFAMVPLYEKFCEITGINGKTSGRYELTQAKVADVSRLVEVQFVASNGADMPWQFRPEVETLKVHPGEPVTIRYIAHNVTGRDMVGHAIPSLQPSRGTRFFHKTECFCFQQQPLQAGERVEMPVVFIVDRDLPADIHKLTLSYTMYDQERMQAVSSADRKTTKTKDNG